MNKNDLFEMEITDIGVDGEGIGHFEGITFFVKDACMGDVIRAKVTKLKKNYGYARVEEVLRPSAFRVTPRCPLYRKCGGCQIQVMDYKSQLGFKQQKVLDNLVRIGRFEQNEMERILLPIIGMENPYRYRNKAQFPVGYDKDGKIVFGFYASRSHTIIPVEDCYLGVEVNATILSLVKQWMEQYGIRPYDETSGKGLLRHVLIRVGFATDEIMVCLVINGRTLPHADALCESLAAVSGMTSVSYNVNCKNTNKILGDETQCIWGQSYITDYIENFAFHISPQSFYQVNPVQTEKLYRTALDFAELTGEESVWDLYCGIGTISLFLSQKAGKVYGVEIIPQAIADARDNALRNHVENAQFFVGKAEEVLPAFYRGELMVNGQCVEADENMLHPDVIVVDPPRKGCDSACLDTMLAMAPSRIVYVSCDSATLARDLRILVDGGYHLMKVQAVDQFCHSTHVETVVLMSKKA